MKYIQFGVNYVLNKTRRIIVLRGGYLLTSSCPTPSRSRQGQHITKLNGYLVDQQPWILSTHVVDSGKNLPGNNSRFPARNYKSGNICLFDILRFRS